ncbi:hypothetical protein [Bacteroides sp. 51]|uniref:hypothetical protein n=1 Tax=Bacteroides sp. 51 TaxID=2302938 RepID=UPI0013D8C36F|nr:hypothetical protein [Bacteroides sp. 51]NDV83375.1 hypothetical protein [Bacteroides sp. 51]
MILHKPTKKLFKNRKEAKSYFGVSYYHKMEKENTDLLFINSNHMATNGFNKEELHGNNKTDK